jgi:tetratricopeptide (TPR) repeat protein
MKKRAEETQKTEDELKARSLQDEFFAYLYLARRCASASVYDKKDDVDRVVRQFPESLSVRFRAAFCPGVDARALEAVLEAEPEFYEAHGILGEAALGGGNLLSAERAILQAYEKIPESPHYAILLASIYFLTEEFERSVEYCDRAVELVPEYRDAYLTKAIGLSYLQRYPEAIDVLNKIVALQFYLLGESHYWLAWNYHELKDNARAQLHIEESKGRLPTNSEVFGLAGTIALENGEVDRAEKEFTEALKYNEANTEALFGLAGVADRRSRWPDGAGFYEKAAAALTLNESSLEEKIAQLKAAPLDETRRARMMAKKEKALRVVQATRAMAFFNAAADWANAGLADKARPLAEKAAAHPQFKDKADDLLSRLKK